MEPRLSAGRPTVIFTLTVGLLLVTGCGEADEHPAATSSPAPPSLPEETDRAPAPDEVPEPVSAAEAPPSASPEPSPEALATAVRQLERHIRAASPIASSEMWKYVHWNGTDNDIAEAIGDEPEPIPEPHRSCGEAARRAAAVEIARLEDEMQDPGLRPQIDCRVEAPRVVCDYTSNPHNTIRFVARVDEAGALDLCVVAQIGSRYVSAGGHDNLAGTAEEERDFAEFVRIADSDRCPTEGATR